MQLDEDESSFPQEAAAAIIKESVESVLSNASYNHVKVIELTMKRLKELNQPFKYIVTCAIMQKNGAGLHMATSTFWDNSSDGSATLKWDSKTMYCMTTVFGLSI